LRETEHSSDELVPIFHDGIIQHVLPETLTAKDIQNSQKAVLAAHGMDESVSSFWHHGSLLPIAPKFNKSVMWNTFEWRGREHEQRQYLPTRTKHIPFYPKPTLFSNVEFDTTKSCPSDVVSHSTTPKGFAFLGFCETRRENMSPKKAAMPRVRKVQDPRTPKFKTRSQLLEHRRRLREAPHLQYSSDLAPECFLRSAQFTTVQFGMNSTVGKDGRVKGPARIFT